MSPQAAEKGQYKNIQMEQQLERHIKKCCKASDNTVNETLHMLPNIDERNCW